MINSDRTVLQRKLFPEGIPKLWCPTLSYFSAAEKFDGPRMQEHLQRLAPHVKGLLVPGSTGEGWEMSDAQILELLDIVLPIAERLDMRVLIGVLKTNTAEVLRAIDELQHRVNSPACVGITVCPAKGAALTQAELRLGLARVLALQIPTALYQLPQVTQNEMSPETVASLAAEFPNFFLFKDTSGEDRVANSQVDLGGVFMVRGSEKNGYASWLRQAGGNYDGFLLSTANCFAGPLSQTIQSCDAGQQQEANRLSSQISHVVAIAFDLASSVKVGNAFTNANKAIDHLQLYGSQYRAHPAPMLIGGTRLPIELLDALANRCPELLT